MAWEEVVFGELAERLTRVIVGLEYASLSSAFPRDDVKLRAAVERLSVDGQPNAIFRPHVDVQAFKGIGGQAVLAAHVLYEGASAPLPPYERSLLGGARTLRGWKAGARVGDHLLATSVELRLPLNSPLVADKTGLRLFYDTAAVWNAGSVRDQWLKGVGRRRVSVPSGRRPRAVRRRSRLARRRDGALDGRVRVLKRMRDRRGVRITSRGICAEVKRRVSVVGGHPRRGRSPT